MAASATDSERTRWQTEVLRRASAILGGKLVGVWEVRPDQSLAPVASNMAAAMAEGAAPKVRDALRRIHMPSPPGSRWVGGQLVTSSGWCVAPVRTMAPDPPERRERRSRGRLALELAGLCLGLSDRLAAGSEVTEPPDPPLQQAPDPAFRAQMLKELAASERALEDATLMLGRSRDSASSVLAPSGAFEILSVVRSVVDAVRAAAAKRGAAIEVETLGPVASVTGSAVQMREVLALLIQSAVLALAGRPGTVGLTLADVGPVVRITIQVPAVIAESALAAARHVVETRFGGDLSVAFQPAEPATTVMLRLAARQEGLPDARRSRPG